MAEGGSFDGRLCVHGATIKHSWRPRLSSDTRVLEFLLLMSYSIHLVTYLTIAATLNKGAGMEARS
jgi:hypothetical protein